MSCLPLYIFQMELYGNLVQFYFFFSHEMCLLKCLMEFKFVQSCCGFEFYFFFFCVVSVYSFFWATDFFFFPDWLEFDSERGWLG
jgi:hypothetical protein